MKIADRAMILSRPAVVVSLCVGFALVAGAAVLSALSTRSIGAAGRRSTHSQETLVTVNRLLTTANEAEAGQRGYLLTHDEKYLLPAEAARARYRPELARLRGQLAGHPTQAPLLDQLETRFDERFAEISRTVGLRRELGIAPALNVVESDEGWRIMHEIRQLIQQIQREELADLAEHSAGAIGRAQIFQALNGIFLALAFILAGTGAWMLFRRVRDLEGLITVCAWTRRVQWRGRWISFEEYLTARFALRCTHGICDEAAQQLKSEIANTPVEPDVPAR